MSSELLDAALNYARQGWPVFPLRVRGKEPLVPNGFHQATTNEFQIETWWRRWPDANIGVPAGPATFCVVDVDPDKGGDDTLMALREEYGSVPETLRQVTGSGGMHYCFQHNPAVGNTESKIGQGIDTRGNNKGYIVVAPSIHKTGNAYQWDNMGAGLAPIPEWLIPPSAVVQEPLVAPAPRMSIPWLSGDDDSDSIEARARAYLRQCEPAIQGAGGHRALLWACTAMVWGYDLDDHTAMRLLSEEYNPRCVPPWNLSKPSEYREFSRKVSEGRKEKQKPRGWLLEEYNREQSILAEHGRNMADALIRSAQRKAGQAPEPAEVVTPEPVELRDATVSAEFPVELLHPPGFIGDLCGYINSKARKKQPLLTLANVLALAGALLGRKVRDEWDLRTNIYCLGVGASSCGKDHSRRCVKDLCARAGVADKLLGGEEVTSDTAIASVLHDHESRLFQWDEIGHMIASMKDKYSSGHRKTIVPMLMKLYSSANTVYLGKEYANADRQDITQPNLCIYGTTVPETLWKGLTTDEIRDGFLGRMLVFISHDDDPEIDDINSRASQPPRHITEKIASLFAYTPDAPATARDVEKVRDVFQVTVPTDKEAQDRFLSFRQYVRNRRQAAAENHESTHFLWGRAEENARKVALIVSAMDSMTIESATITLQHAEYACRLVTALLNDFTTAVGDNIAETKVELTLRKIFRWVRESKEKGVPRRVITNRLRNPRERDEALDELLKEGEIFEVKKDGKKHYFVLPYGTEYLEKKQKRR